MAFSRILIQDQKGETSRIHDMTDVEHSIQYIETKSKAIEWIEWTNSGALAYLKLYNTLGATLGTTAPNMVIPIIASGNGRMTFKPQLSSIFTNVLGIAAVTTEGVGGVTPPAGSVDVRLAVREVVGS